MDLKSIVDIKILNSTPDTNKRKQEKESGINPCPGPPEAWCYFCLKRLQTLTKKKNRYSERTVIVQHYRQCLSVQALLKIEEKHDNSLVIASLVIADYCFYNQIINFYKITI